MAFAKGLVIKALSKVTFSQQVAAATLLTSNFIFTNPTNENYKVLAVHYNYDVAGGAAAAIDVRRVPSGSAAAATGTSVLSSTLDLTAAARTPRKGTVSTTLSNILVGANESLSLIFSGTLTGLVGCNVVVELQPLRGLRGRP